MSKKRIAINIILVGIISGLSTYLIGNGIIGIILGIFIGQIFHLGLLYKIKIYNIGITSKNICLPKESEDYFIFKINCVRHDINRISVGFSSPHSVEQFPLFVHFYIKFFSGYHKNNLVKVSNSRPIFTKSLGWFPVIYKRGYEEKEPFCCVVHKFWGIYNNEKGPLYNINVEKVNSCLQYTLEDKILKKISKIIESEEFTEEFNKALPKI